MTAQTGKPVAVDLLEEQEPDEVAAYCPECWAVEFGDEAGEGGGSRRGRGVFRCHSVATRPGAWQPGDRKPR